MKKLFIAGAALTLLMTGSAHATDKLPDAMMGTWCLFNGDNIQLIYSRVRTPGMGGCETKIEQNAFFEENNICVFEKIEQIRANTFEVFTRCIDLPDNEPGELGGGPARYELIDGKLIITLLPEG